MKIRVPTLITCADGGSHYWRLIRKDDGIQFKQCQKCGSVTGFIDEKQIDKMWIPILWRCIYDEEDNG